MSKGDEIYITQELKRAFHFHQHGKLVKAEKIYRNILSTAPKHSVALHYLGLVALQVGKFNFAIDLIQESIDETPEYVEAHGNLGNAYQANGQFEQSIESFQNALNIDDTIAIYWANIANAKLQLKHYEMAILDYQRAIKLNPDLAEVHRNLAMLYLQSYKVKEAVKSIDCAYKLQPNSLSIIVTKGNIHKELYQFEDALHFFQKALSLDPKSIKLICNLASLFSEMQRGDDALDMYDKALAISANDGNVLFSKAILYQQLGDNKLAEIQIKKILKLQPNNTKALSFSTTLKTDVSGDKVIERMLELVSNEKTANNEKIPLSFALGKVYSDLNNYKSAFYHFNEGNKLKRSSFEYSSQTDIDTFNQIKKQFPVDLFNKFSHNVNPDIKTIFIVGMPRSGTTLVEQILNCHSKTHTLGEISLLKQSVNEIFMQENNSIDNYEGISVETLGSAANLYLNKIDNIAKNSKILINKLPMNFLYVGLIKLMLPNSIIINCNRQPIDTCFSIYKNNFSKSGHKYAYDQKELGLYYNLYLDLMKHWNTVLKNPFFEIKYEDLVFNQERTSKKLIEACGLKWESSCLEFFNHKRQINTLSVTQVRQPIYSQSVDKWKKYSSLLSTLTNELNRNN